MASFASTALLLVILIASVKSDYAECLAGLGNVAKGVLELTSSNRSNYGDMAAYSGTNVNDLGNYHRCKYTSDAKYVIFQILDRPYLVLGFCGPDVCTKDDYYAVADNITNLIKEYENPTLVSLEYHRRRLYENTELIAQASFSVYFPLKEADHLRDDFDAGAIIMLLVLSILLGTVMAGTAYEYVYPEESNKESFMFSVTSLLDEVPMIPKVEPWYYKCLRCFSLYKNLAYWQTSPIVEVTAEESNLKILEGVLLVSVGWVVLGQIFLYRVYYTVIDNIDTVTNLYKQSAISVIEGALFAPDTCLFISGLISAYVGVKLCVSGQSIFFLFLDKGARYYPTYIMIFFMNWSLLKHIGIDGPMWYSIQHVTSQCHNKWFSYMFLFSNLYKTNETNCMANAWFLASDFQFFLLVPPICWLYVNYSRIWPYMLTLAMCIVTVVSSWLIVYNLEILTPIVTGIDRQDYHYFTDYYFKPYTRAAPYFIGVLAGLVVFSWNYYQQKGQVIDSGAFFVAKTIYYNRIVRYLMYAVGMFLVNYLIFVQLPEWEDANSFDRWSNDQNSAFLALSHLGWGLALVCLLLPIMLGRNPLIGRIMSYHAWSAIERLSVGTYLITCVILSGIAKTQQIAYNFSSISIFMDFFAIFPLALAFSLAFFLVIGAPIIQLWKLKAYIPAGDKPPTAFELKSN